MRAFRLNRKRKCGNTVEKKWRPKLLGRTEGRMRDHRLGVFDIAGQKGSVKFEKSESRKTGDRRENIGHRS